MSGYAPLTYTTIRDWSLLMGTAPDAEDVDALFALDAVLRNPGDEKTD